MTNFLHWHTMTWVLVLWSGYIATWMVVSGSGPSIVALWWLAGMIVFGLLWLASSHRSKGAWPPGPVRGYPIQGQQQPTSIETTWATEPRRDAS